MSETDCSFSDTPG